MNIYLLKRVDTERIGYDEVDSAVVLAGSEREAREFFAGTTDIYSYGPGDEGREAWTDESRTTAQRVGYSGNTISPETICRSYNAG